jgi:hypothetical protein
MAPMWLSSFLENDNALNTLMMKRYLHAQFKG